MGIIGTIGSIVIFPFRLIFGGKKKGTSPEETPMTDYSTPQYTPVNQPSYSTDVATENLKAKVDLMLTQVDSLKIEYEAINQRIQNIEKMVRELYAMAKS
ncbi:MAG: hypothetical protein HYS62_03125 [Candidatus Aenigmarchaeota archaeon]|nr:hypothetical protein [Candidatus Aenigmarchaeota archaeon]